MRALVYRVHTTDGAIFATRSFAEASSYKDTAKSLGMFVKYEEAVIPMDEKRNLILDTINPNAKAAIIDRKARYEAKMAAAQ